MAKKTPSRVSSREPTLVITRIFDAPRELVWKVWTEPKHVRHWWGPRDFTAPYATIDLRIGGKFHFCMRSPDGTDYWSLGVYQEIAAPKKIVATMYFSDKDANILKPTDFGMGSDFPAELHDIITFEALAGHQTKFTLRRNTPESVAKRYGEDQGWNQSLDRFARELAKLARKSKK